MTVVSCFFVYIFSVCFLDLSKQLLRYWAFFSPKYVVLKSASFRKTVLYLQLFNTQFLLLLLFDCRLYYDSRDVNITILEFSMKNLWLSQGFSVQYITRLSLLRTGWEHSSHFPFSTYVLSLKIFPLLRVFSKMRAKWVSIHSHLPSYIERASLNNSMETWIIVSTIIIFDYKIHYLSIEVGIIQWRALLVYTMLRFDDRSFHSLFMNWYLAFTWC